MRCLASPQVEKYYVTNLKKFGHMKKLSICFYFTVNVYLYKLQKNNEEAKKAGEM